MKALRSWLVLAAICLTLLSGCSAMAGAFDHWPGSLSAVGLMVAGKLLNERVKVLKWPMEFAFWSAILFIMCNLVYLHFKPL